MNYYVLKDGQRNGPHSLEEIKGMICRGEYLLSGKIWREGLFEWTTISDLPELVDKIIPAPPSKPVQNLLVAECAVMPPSETKVNFAVVIAYGMFFLAIVLAIAMFNPSVGILRTIASLFSHH
jgi:hypothetical protein